MAEDLTRELVDDFLEGLAVDHPLEIEARAIDAARHVAPAGLRGAKDLCDELADRPDPRAHAMLAAFSLYAPSPLNTVADHCRRRAAGDHALADQVGTASVDAAWRAYGAEGEAFVAELIHPGSEARSGVLVMFGREGLPFEGALLTAPPPEEDDGFPELAAKLADGPVEPIDPGALGERVKRGAEALATSGLGGPSGLAAAVGLVAQAALGDARAAPPIGPEPPPVGDLRPRGAEQLETEAHAVISELRFVADGLGREFGDEHAAAVAELLEWKASRDRRLDRWRVKDVDALLLDFAPSRFVGTGEAAPALPDALHQYLQWLAATDRLRGDDVDALVDRVAALAPEFEARAEEARRSSPVAAMWDQMRREGLDVGDHDAVQAWMDAFNARPFAERDAILGPSLERRRAAADKPRGDSRREARKRQRAGRRANRRR